MGTRLTGALFCLLGLAACNDGPPPDNNALNQQLAETATLLAGGLVTPEPAEPATGPAPTVTPSSLASLSGFTIVDPNGIHSGRYRSTGGDSWRGPDLVRGGEIAFEEVFRRDDQVVLSAVRQAPLDDWDIYEVSIQAGGRVYIAYRAAGGDSFRPVPDHTATDLAF